MLQCGVSVGVTVDVGDAIDRSECITVSKREAYIIKTIVRPTSTKVRIPVIIANALIHFESAFRLARAVF